MIKEDKISIIIPVYNAEQYLENCLKNVVNQTYKNLEIILIDDGSKDKSSMICDIFGEKYNNIKVFHTKNNGVSSARNFGIEKSTGKYIMFIDADDKIDLNACKQLIEEYNKDKSIELIMFDFFCDAKKKKNKENKIECLDRVAAIKTIIDDKKILGYVWNKVFKRNIIIENNIKFEEKIHMCEDFIFCIEYLKKIDKIKVLYNYNLYNYNYTEESITKAGFNIKRYTVIDAYKVLKEKLKDLNNKKINQMLEMDLIKHELWLWWHAKKENNKKIVNKNLYMESIKKDIKKAKLNFLFSNRAKIKYKIIFVFLKII